jgi:ribosomal protein S18 acetylase RimI-like enzyme
MHVEYRSALPEDATECVAVRGKTRENAVSAAQLRSIGITAKSWAGNIRSGALPGYVCTFQENIVGYCFGARETGEIEVLAVLPDFENRGIGRELLGRTIKHLAEAGHSRLFLGCSPIPTSRSYGFYRHLGWRSTETFDEYGDEILEIFVEPQSLSTP